MKRFLSKIPFLLIWSMSFLLACTPRQKVMTEIELMDLARSIDPNTEIVLPSEENPKVNCDFYGDGCEYGLTIRFKNLIIIVVKFTTVPQAQEASFQFDAYTRANWLFDYVTGEPLLEEIFSKKFQAVKIQRPGVQRVPYESLRDKSKKENKNTDNPNP